MRVLVIAATEFELGNLIADFKNEAERNGAGQHGANLKSHISYLLTGVGMTATAFALGRELATNQYDLAINLGIAGSFDRNIALGEVVEVTDDRFSELGAEDDAAFLTIDELGFGESVFNSTASLTDFGLTLKQVNSITVNTVHGNQTNIQKLTSRIKPQLESMEGAAFFYACKQGGVPAMQIRAVSNYVEKRNRDAWQIGLAIKNLNSFAIELLKQIDRR